LSEITFQVPAQCQQLAEYLNRRLEKPSACVKLKVIRKICNIKTTSSTLEQVFLVILFQVLKIMIYLIQNGHPNFRHYLRRNDSYVKLAVTYNGPPDPLLGMSPYENVRKTAQVMESYTFFFFNLQCNAVTDLKT
jgi:hypothetical protein